MSIKPMERGKDQPNVMEQFSINKNDSKYLSKLQLKKAQYLYENDYFIWNEAEMYLRYHEIFSVTPNSDVLYEKICKTTRVVFNQIHDVHFGNTGSNAAHLKFFEVLDAWGALSLYLKKYDRFPKVFLDWFESIFAIYSFCNENQQNFVPQKHLTCLYLISGVNSLLANQAFNKITFDLKHQLTFNHLIHLLKYIVISDDEKHYSYALVPKLQEAILENNIRELPPEEVIRNYDFFDKKESVYSNLTEYWNNSNVQTDLSLNANMIVTNKSSLTNQENFKDSITEPTNSTSGVFDGYTTNDRETFSNTEPTSKLSSINNKCPLDQLKDNNARKLMKSCSNNLSSNQTKNEKQSILSSDHGILPLSAPAFSIQKKSTDTYISNNDISAKKPPPLPPTLFTLNSNQITYSLNKNEKIIIKSNMNKNVITTKSDKEDINANYIKKPKSNFIRQNAYKSSSINELDNISMNTNNTSSNFSLNEFRKEFKKLPTLLTNYDPKKSLFKNSAINNNSNNQTKHSFYSQNDLSQIDNSPKCLPQVISLNKIPQCKVASSFYDSNCKLNKQDNCNLQNLESDYSSDENSEFENLNINNLDANKKSILSFENGLNNNYLQYKIKNHLEIIKKQNDYVRSTLINKQQEKFQRIPNSSSSSQSISSSLSSVSSVSKQAPKIEHHNKHNQKQRLRNLSAHEITNTIFASNLSNTKPKIGKSLEINISNEDDLIHIRNDDKMIRSRKKPAKLTTEINLPRSSAHKQDIYQHQPIKSAINGVTLSSVDTLYDIDDEYDTVHLTSHSPQMPPLHKFSQPSSKNHQSHIFGVNDYKLMYEIIRKIKPYINNCIKLEVRNYFEKYIMNEHVNYLRTISNKNHYHHHHYNQ